jgi:hypothetical protein
MSVRRNIGTGAVIWMALFSASLMVMVRAAASYSDVVRALLTMTFPNCHFDSFMFWTTDFLMDEAYPSG